MILLLFQVCEDDRQQRGEQHARPQPEVPQKIHPQILAAAYPRDMWEGLAPKPGKHVCRKRGKHVWQQYQQYDDIVRHQWRRRQIQQCWGRIGSDVVFDKCVDISQQKQIIFPALLQEPQTSTLILKRWLDIFRSEKMTKNFFSFFLLPDIIELKVPLWYRSSSAIQMILFLYKYCIYNSDENQCLSFLKHKSQKILSPRKNLVQKKVNISYDFCFIYINLSIFITTDLSISLKNERTNITHQKCD